MPGSLVQRSKQVWFRCIDGFEIEFEGAMIHSADPVGRPGQTHTIRLQAVSQLRLRKAVPSFEAFHDGRQSFAAIVVETMRGYCNDGCEKDAADPRRGFDRKMCIAEGHPPGRRYRTGMPHVELGDDHSRGIYRYRPVAAHSPDNGTDTYHPQAARF